VTPGEQAAWSEDVREPARSPTAALDPPVLASAGMAATTAYLCHSRPPRSCSVSTTASSM
ncbi:unnamed protein product, partial [Prorocentrum cordatum]